MYIFCIIDFQYKSNLSYYSVTTHKIDLSIIVLWVLEKQYNILPFYYDLQITINSESTSATFNVNFCILNLTIRSS